MRSIEAILRDNKGLAPGFDFLRVALAICIVAFHSTVVCGSDEDARGSPLWLLVYALVPMFFTLSGFLITGSALRLRLRDFLLNRSLRIVPALAVEILVSAMLLGPLLTELPLRQYFSASEFYSYAWNIVGYIHYTLPGVFSGNLLPRIVNLSLWTIPFEVVCYLLMSIMMLSGTLKRPITFALTICLFLCLPFALYAAGGAQVVGSLANTAFHGRQYIAVEGFLLGCLAFIYRSKLVLSNIAFAFCLLSFSLISVFGTTTWKETGLLNLIACPIFSYMTIYIGSCRIPKLPLFSRGDYSYGIYLYGFPIQQSVYALLPTTRWWENFAISICIATSVAIVSWHGIEKRVLRSRQRFSFVGRRIAAQDANAAGAMPTPAQTGAPMRAENR